MLIGPFHDDEATCPVADEDYLLGEATARPEAGDTYGNNNWRRVTANSGGYVDCTSQVVNAADVQAYGALWVFAREAQDVILHVGTDDGGKAWWNGERLFDNRICRGFDLEDHEIPLTIEPGLHRLLIKVRNHAAAIGFWRPHHHAERSTCARPEPAHGRR